MLYYALVFLIVGLIAGAPAASPRPLHLRSGSRRVV